jgi:ABC-type antimicrobial peptide transport system permease subunit
LILCHGGLLAGVGIVIGLLLSAVTAPLMSSVVYGIHILDPVVFLAVPVILLVVSFAASYFPARRASKISPIEALREA